MSNPHNHARCPACGGHIAITLDNTVLPELSDHRDGCWWRPGMPAPASEKVDHFARWEHEMQETQP